jgi:hypothetical protein
MVYFEVLKLCVIIFMKWDVGVWTGLGWLRIKTGGGQFVNAVMNLCV